MPTLTINKFFGLHDGTPEQPGFFSKCDNLWITQDGKLSKRGGIHPLHGSDFTGSVLGSTGAVFTLEARKQDWSDDGDYSDLNTRTLFVFEGTGILRYRNPSSTWGILNLANGNPLPASSQITSASVHEMNDIALLCYTTKSSLTETHENFSYIIYAHATLGWRIFPAWCLTRPFTDNLSNEGQVQDLGGGTDGPRVVAYVPRGSFTTANGVTYEVVGRPTFASVPNRSFRVYFPAVAVSDYDVGLGGYDLQAYITEPNGSVLYRVNNLVRDWTSTASGNETWLAADVADTSGDILYTQTGEIANDEFRYQSNVSCVTSEGIFWCLDEDTGRVRQSKPLQPWAWPGSFETTFKRRPVAMASTDRFPIVFTDQGVYRIEGFLAADGTGASRVVEIANTVGTFNQDSVLTVEKIVYFLSNDGVYQTDGFNVRKISGHINKTYALYFNKWKDLSEIGAFASAYDSVNKMIYFGLKDPVGLTKFLIGYPDIRHEMGIAFTSMTSVFGGKVAAIKNAMLFCDRPRDYVSILPTSTREVDPLLDDDFINLFYDKTYDGVQLPITYDALTTPMNFGDSIARKYVTKMRIAMNKTTQNPSAFTGIYGLNDYTGEHEVRQIRHLNADVRIPVWNRHFPSGHLRCTSKQVGLFSEAVVISSYLDYGIGSLVGDIFTVPSGSFPSLSPEEDNWVSYKIYFEHEGYAVGHEILTHGINSIQLTVNPSNDASDIGWKIISIPKNIPMLVESISIDFEQTGDSHTDYTPFRGGDGA